MREVVVTGFGTVAPLGITVPEFREKMFAGKSAISDIRGSLVADTFPVPVAAVVPRDRLRQPASLNHLDPESTPLSWRYAGAATEEALSYLDRGNMVDAILYATADGVNFDLLKQSFRSFDPAKFPWEETQAETCVELIRDMINAHGNGYVPDHRVISINNACISSNQAIGIALHRIRSGQWARAVVGGVDARCNDHNLMNFHLLGALTTQPGPTASCPFSRNRSGFVRGEGAATLVLESLEAAKTRKAKVLAYVRGYAATTDAYRLTDGRPDALGAIHALEGAIKDAGCGKESVSAISAHGTSTKMNDRLETAAVKTVFGARAYQLPVTSLKSQLGHATVAAGAIEAVASILMLQEQKLAPTINYSDPDPECDLDYVPNVSRPWPLEIIVSNNFGFGGQNACVVFERAVA